MRRGARPPWWLWPLLFVLAGLWFAPWPDDGSLSLAQADWQVQAPGVAPDAAAWRPVALPHAPPVQVLGQARAALHPGGERVSWYRLHLPAVTPSERAPDWALYAPRVRSDGTVAIYLDGRLLQQSQGQLLWNSSRTPLWLALPGSSSTTSELLIRLQHSAQSRPALAALRVGPRAALSWRWHARQWLQRELPMLGGGAFLAAGLFSLVVWCRRRVDLAYLLFFGLAATTYLRSLHFHLALPIAQDLFAWLSLNALFWQLLVGHAFAGLLHQRPQRAFGIALLGLSALVGLLTLPLGLPISLPNTPLTTPLIYLLAMLMGTLVCLHGSWRSLGRSSEGLWVSAGIGLCLLLGVGDWLLQNHRLPMAAIYPGAYAGLVSFAIFGRLMVLRYASAMQRLAETHRTLAQRLAQRERELAASHAQLRELDRAQALALERQRLMQDMHDGLGATLHSSLRVLERAALAPAQVEALLLACLHELDFALQAMTPSATDLGQLLAMLHERLAPRLRSAGIELGWAVAELPALDWLDARCAQHVLRILQEALANVLKHTRASRIGLQARVEQGMLQLTVRDNGAGFDLEEALRRGGQGLRNQRRRAEAIGARVSWEANEDRQGSCFGLHLPLRRAGDLRSLEAGGAAS